MTRHAAAFLAALLAALALGACGGDDEPAAESIPTPPKLTVPGESGPPDIPDKAETADEDEQTDTDTTTGTSTAPAATTPEPSQSGGTQAPATGGAPADSPQNDQPPPANSPAAKFEEFCSENPGAC